MIERIGPYTITRELGRGGMGVVYLATDARLDRQVAIKALPVELASDPARLERFEREAKTLAQLNHPNLAGIHGVEEQDGARYLVLEFVEGETIADRLDRGPIPVEEAIELAIQIAAGVEAAHDAGVIHRDLKPANIIVTPDGQAKVLDFGLARADDAGAPVRPRIRSVRRRVESDRAGCRPGSRHLARPVLGVGHGRHRVCGAA
jgi:serine/threonine protein kinase